jgi:hypothetical protein
MGKKRAVHVVQVEREFGWMNYYAVKYKRSKCRHAQTRMTYVQAKDELDAYMKVAINKEGVW